MSQQLKIGEIAVVTKNPSGLSLEVGDIVVIWRHCLEGYKVVPGTELPTEGPDENIKWWYLEEDEVKLWEQKNQESENPADQK